MQPWFTYRCWKKNSDCLSRSLSHSSDIYFICDCLIVGTWTMRLLRMNGRSWCAFSQSARRKCILWIFHGVDRSRVSLKYLRYFAPLNTFGVHWITHRFWQVTFKFIIQLKFSLHLIVQPYDFYARMVTREAIVTSNPAIQKLQLIPCK